MDQSIFEKGLRVRTHAPCELSHVSLTALVRSAQRTGFYACILDALSRGSVMTIPTIMLCTTTISRCAPTASVRYTQNLKLVSLSFSPRQHAQKKHAPSLFVPQTRLQVPRAVARAPLGWVIMGSTGGGVGLQATRR